MNFFHFLYILYIIYSFTIKTQIFCIQLNKWPLIWLRKTYDELCFPLWLFVWMFPFDGQRKPGLVQSDWKLDCDRENRLLFWNLGELGRYWYSASNFKYTFNFDLGNGHGYSKLYLQNIYNKFRCTSFSLGTMTWLWSLLKFFNRCYVCPLRKIIPIWPKPFFCFCQLHLHDSV